MKHFFTFNLIKFNTLDFDNINIVFIINRKISYKKAPENAVNNIINYAKSTKSYVSKQVEELNVFMN